LTTAVMIVLLGAALFSLTEHISYGVALYWSITTATAVGYGDVTPHNTAGSRVLGIAREGRVDLGVGDDPILAAGDRLVVLDRREQTR
jgi:voltage-gated potassium channel Kch